MARIQSKTSGRKARRESIDIIATTKALKKALKEKGLEKTWKNRDDSRKPRKDSSKEN